MPSLTPVGFALQRFSKDAAPISSEAAAAPAGETAPATVATAAATSLMPGVIVDDGAAALAAGQMTQSAFLAQLRAAVCATVEQGLSGTIWSVAGCPWIDHWFNYYAGRSGEQIERAIARYAPEASGVQTAGELIPIVCARVEDAVATWSATGELTGVPDEAAGPAPEAGGGAPAQAGPLFKRDGSAESGAPRATRAHMGSGRSLDGGVRTRMESAFGKDFSQVRVHTDGGAGRLSAKYSARAFTVGDHIAFGTGEYQPGSPVGDALLAHELAHVVQQGGATSSSSALPQPDSGGAAEEEADLSALHVVSALWSGARVGLSTLGSRAAQLTRSGLRLQRCKSDRQKEIERLAHVEGDFLEEKRKQEEEKQRKQAEEDAKAKGVVNPKIDVKVTTDDVLKNEVTKGALQKGPDVEWTSQLKADQDDWTYRRAPEAWNKVVASVKGTELEKVMAGWNPGFEPQVALQEGRYAWTSGTSKIFHFGMSWVKNVEADPKNVWPNVAHEIGGHSLYGDLYSTEVMDEFRSTLPKSESDRLKTQQAYETYEYPETEIYAALRERRYSNPETGPAPNYGSIKPDQNIPNRLKIMQGALAPEVAKAVLSHLKAKVDANPEILPRDKKFFTDQVKAVFGFDL
ncbi:MAG: DUF4157 domain-containing protein [Bryobacteraceae bacterium]